MKNKNKWKIKRVGIKRIPIKWLVLIIIITSSVITTRDVVKKFYAETTQSYVSLSECNNLKINCSIIKSEKQILEQTIMEITMYTSRPEETDASPCIGASGQDQCVLWRNGQNICATNKYPKGTVLKIDKLGECLVMDRMNSRYQNRIDWYAGYDDDCLNGYDKYDVCPNLKRAKEFGLQNLLVKIIN